MKGIKTSKIYKAQSFSTTIMLTWNFVLCDVQNICRDVNANAWTALQLIWPRTSDCCEHNPRKGTKAESHKGAMSSRLWLENDYPFGHFQVFEWWLAQLVQCVGSMATNLKQCLSANASTRNLGVEHLQKLGGSQILHILAFPHCCTLLGLASVTAMFGRQCPVLGTTAKLVVP